MKNILIAAAAFSAIPAFAADVGVSVNVGQPGFYGQINIGNVAPQVIYPQPVIIQQAPEYVGGPIYLHVPPGHEKHWGKHCAQYNACGRPVYFVRDDWYNNEYAPRHGHGGDDEGDDHGHGHGKGHGHGHGHKDD
ncbi:MAG: hypothetical protein JWR07_641 [Nevskia sp.]|nr:hypothetical protein [Nevskia sp.]